MRVWVVRGWYEQPQQVFEKMQQNPKWCTLLKILPRKQSWIVNQVFKKFSVTINCGARISKSCTYFESTRSKTSPYTPTPHPHPWIFNNVFLKFSVTVNCGARISENCTYFESTGSETGACKVTICRCNSNVCQVIISSGRAQILETARPWKFEIICLSRVQIWEMKITITAIKNKHFLICKALKSAK